MKTQLFTFAISFSRRFTTSELSASYTANAVPSRTAALISEGSRSSAIRSPRRPT